MSRRRMRTSTLVLLVVFLGALVLYLAYRPRAATTSSTPPAGLPAATVGPAHRGGLAAARPCPAVRRPGRQPAAVAWKTVCPPPNTWSPALVDATQTGTVASSVTLR